DDVTGTLTSVPFKVTQPWASFLIAGGSTELNRVEIVHAADQKVIFKVSGLDTENLRPVVVDLQAYQGQEIFIRVIDQQIGGWGHINFDNFEFHAQRPKFANEIDSKTIAANVPPPADKVLYAGLSPEDAARLATLPPGFKMHLFAGEPDVKQPIAFALDDRGRVWVAEGYTYPRRMPEGQGKDRIIVFEDTNGDHKFDKRTVFMEGLNLVSGLEVGFGGVWVGAAPYLMFIPGKDWDNPAPAGKPEILLDGWNYTADTHETLNTFTWGPDGWLYGCHGVFCPSNVGKPGAPESERQWVDAAVWRFHPVRKVFEIFAEGTSNPWGVDFDERGQCWIEACVIPHLWHMIQGGRYERQGGEHYTINRDETARNEQYRQRGRKPVFPFVYEDIKTVADHVHWAGNKGPHAGNERSDAAGGGHAHAGMMVYLGDSWPAEYRGQMFMGNIHGQRLNVDIAERSGSGFVGHHGKDFVNFNDAWSQTLNQLYDQDGSVYIIDWYDKNQCHHNNVDGHDRTNGRIFHIVYNNQKHTIVDLQKNTDEELVRLQLSPNDWYVRHARRILQERAAKNGMSPQVHAALAKIVRENPDTTRKLRALWALHVTGGINAELGVEFIKSPDEYVRAWLFQLVFEDPERLAQLVAEADSKGIKADPSPTDMAAHDPSPVVRLYIASALQRMPLESRWKFLAALTQHSEDAKDHNLPLMCWFALEPLVAEDPARALGLALESKLPRLLNFAVRRATTLGTAQSMAEIARILSSLSDEARQMDILSGLSMALKGQRSVPMPQGWDQVETKLGASANADIRTLAQSLSLTFGSANARSVLRGTLSDANASPGARRTALDS
ncbi:MAG TPA: PVC-type heme-binding CxxCH protein, partial [Verrucomicrobiae bacterium]|nr:PVC-type heme-binding CxxCH protein [Verrucomicrobiae bacterium]